MIKNVKQIEVIGLTMDDLCREVNCKYVTRSNGRGAVALDGLNANLRNGVSGSTIVLMLDFALSLITSINPMIKWLLSFVTLILREYKQNYALPF